MPRLNPLSAPSRLRERRHQRSRRLLASRAVAENLVTVAGVIGRPVRNPSAAEIGTVKDVVARWDGGEYPPVTGLVVRIGRRLAFVPGTQIETLGHREVVLRSARLDLADFERREGEVLLVEDVIDHQLVDVDGVRVIRAADLYVAKVGAMYRLVGVDVSVGSLLRRLGPTRWRAAAHPRASDRLGGHPTVRPSGQPDPPARRRNRGAATGSVRASSPTSSRSSGAGSVRSCWPRSNPRPPPTRSRRWTRTSSKPSCGSRARSKPPCCSRRWSPTRPSTRCATSKRTSASSCSA